MMGLIPRLIPAALCAAALSLSALPALAQSGEQKPAEQPTPAPGPAADSAKNGKKIDELTEAAKTINGPAGNAECVWLGRRVVSLLWRDDLDTAFRHLDLYDRFGCPSSHIQSSFRCLVRMGPFDSKANEKSDAKPQEGKQPESLNSRVHACWVKPEQTGAAEAPAATTDNPARR